MTDKKSYYAIIPANVRYDKNLTANAKLLYGEITALCNEKGYCWASNSYFAELYEVSKQSVSVWINSLHKNGYIDIEMIRKGKEITKRKVSIKTGGVSINLDEGINKSLIGYQENLKENNTSNSTFNKEESQETETMKTAKVLASLLLEKCREVDKKYCLGKEERTIDGWAADIDKLIRLDKRTESEVREVIIWSKKDDFWSPNIMSGKKLRMKFPMLFAQMSKSKAQAERKRPRTREEIRAEMIARYGDK